MSCRRRADPGRMFRGRSAGAERAAAQGRRRHARRSRNAFPTAAASRRSTKRRPTRSSSTNKCEQRLKCQIFVYIISAKGPVQGHATLLAPKSAARRPKSYVLKVKMLGGITQSRASAGCSGLERRRQVSMSCRAATCASESASMGYGPRSAGPHFARPLADDSRDAAPRSFRSRAAWRCMMPPWQQAPSAGPNCPMPRGGHPRHAASVDAGGRQDPPRAHALAQSFLARRALCHRARADHLADPGRRAHVPDRFRLHRPRAVGANERRPFPPAHARADGGGGILRRRDDRAQRARHRRRRSAPCRAKSPTAFRSSRTPCTPPTMPATPTGSGACCSRAQRGAGAFPHRLSRQSEPGAFLLGQLRSGGDAVFRAARAAPSRRRAASARRGGARGLFARGVERGLLAGRRRTGRLCGVLFLRLSGAGGFCGGAR